MLYLSQGFRFRKVTHVKQLNEKKARTNLYQEQYSIPLQGNT